MHKNDEINENFTLTKQKKLKVYKQRSIYVWLGNPSLPCSVEGCIYGTFSRIFNNYDPDIRCRMLSRSKPINKNNKKVSWQWDDRNIEKKIIKMSTKRSVALYFAKCMYITKNPQSKLLRQDLKHSVKIHTIDMIPTLWRAYV